MTDARAVISRSKRSSIQRPKPLRAQVGRALMHPAVHGNRAQSLTELQVPAGQRTELHRHLAAEELYYVLSGRGQIQVGDNVFQVADGDVIAIPAGAPHRIECSGPVKMRVLLCSAPPHADADTELLEPAEPRDSLADYAAHEFSDDLELEEEPEPDPAAPPLLITTGSQAVALRKSLKYNQKKFWKPVGITQSGASRYETGRNIPLNVLYVLHLAYSPDPDAVEALLSYLRKPLDNARYKPAFLPQITPADGSKALAIRQRLDINQRLFWGSLGTTQSAGSRYENGRAMPPGVTRLLGIVFAHTMQAEKRLAQLRGKP